MIIPIDKIGDKRKCINYRGISFINVPGKVYAKCLEKKCCVTVELKLTDAQCGFHPGQSAMDQIFALQQIFEKSLEYVEKAYDRILRDKLWVVLLQYGIDGQLFNASCCSHKHQLLLARTQTSEWI